MVQDDWINQVKIKKDEFFYTDVERISRDKCDCPYFREDTLVSVGTPILNSKKRGLYHVVPFLVNKA